LCPLSLLSQSHLVLSLSVILYLGGHGVLNVHDWHLVVSGLSHELDDLASELGIELESAWCGLLDVLATSLGDAAQLDAEQFGISDRLWEALLEVLPDGLG